jgi:homoserine dehydrogenase
MAHVNGVMNGVVVKGDAAGLTLYCGAGAGSEQTASAVIADLVDVARLDGTRAAQRVPHLGFHAHAMRALPVFPRAEVRTAHYLRVPLREAQAIETMSGWLAAQQVPVRELRLAAAEIADAPQLLVLTQPMLQRDLDLVLHALALYPAAAGDPTTLRVEELAA